MRGRSAPVSSDGRGTADRPRRAARAPQGKVSDGFVARMAAGLQAWVDQVRLPACSRLRSLVAQR
jgi:hypothetical protein